MLRILLPLSFASGLAFAQESAQNQPIPELQEIHCPDPSLMLVTQIPSSIHSAVTATTPEGFGFGYYGFIYAEPTSLNFYAAEVSPINNFWRLYCAYEKGGVGLALSTRDRPGYANCHFADDTQECHGSLEECVLLCPKDSIQPDVKIKSIP